MKKQIKHRYDDLGKPIKQTNFKVKNLGEWSQENNPLYQIEIYNKKYQFVVNLITITKLSSKPLRLLWFGSALTQTSNSHFRSPKWTSSLWLQDHLWRFRSSTFDDWYAATSDLSIIIMCRWNSGSDFETSRHKTF